MKSHVVGQILLLLLLFNLWNSFIDEVERNFSFDRLFGGQDRLLFELPGLDPFLFEFCLRPPEIDFELLFTVVHEQPPTSQKIGLHVELQAHVIVHLFFEETFDIDVSALHFESEFLLPFQVVFGQEVSLVGVDVAEMDKTEKPCPGIGQKDTVRGHVGGRGSVVDDLGQADDLLVFEVSIKLEAGIGSSSIERRGMKFFEFVSVVTDWGRQKSGVDPVAARLDVIERQADVPDIGKNNLPGIGPFERIKKAVVFWKKFEENLLVEGNGEPGTNKGTETGDLFRMFDLVVDASKIAESVAHVDRAILGHTIADPIIDRSPAQVVDDVLNRRKIRTTTDDVDEVDAEADREGLGEAVLGDVIGDKGSVSVPVPTSIDLRDEEMDMPERGVVVLDGQENGIVTESSHVGPESIDNARKEVVNHIAELGGDGHLPEWNIPAEAEDLIAEILGVIERILNTIETIVVAVRITDPVPTRFGAIHIINGPDKIVLPESLQRDFRGDPLTIRGVIVHQGVSEESLEMRIHHLTLLSVKRGVAFPRIC